MRAVSWLLVCGLVLVGCGTADPDARTWAKQVCTALQPWKTEIDELTDEANAALSPDSSPTQAKKDLLTLLSGAAKATQTAHDAIADAGVPDVADGRKLAKRFTDALSATRDAYRTARDGIAELDETKSDFYDSVAEVMERLSKDYAAVPQVAKLDSDELHDAFASVKQCE